MSVKLKSRFKPIYLALAVAFLILTILTPNWLHSDFITLCDWLFGVGMSLNVLLVLFDKRFEKRVVLNVMLLIISFTYLLTTIELNEELGTYLLRLEYIFSTQVSIDKPWAEAMEIANLLSLILWVVLQFLNLRVLLVKSPDE